MLLHWGAEYLEKLVPENLRGRRLREPRCDPDLDAVQETIGPVPFIDAVSGKIIAEIPIPDINRVSRMKLRRFLTEHQNLNVQVRALLSHIYFDQVVESLLNLGNRISCNDLTIMTSVSSINA